MQALRADRSLTVQSQISEHNTDKNHAVHTDLQGLPSSGRSRHPSVEEAPDLPVCQEHPEVPLSAPDPHRYPHNTEPDGVPVSSEQMH